MCVCVGGGGGGMFEGGMGMIQCVGSGPSGSKIFLFFIFERRRFVCFTFG